MIKEIYTAAMGMLPQQTRLEVVANNIANSDTIGFKRESVFENRIIDAISNMQNIPGDAEPEDSNIGSYIDFSFGVMKHTGNSLDIAIDREGFFELQDEAGNVFFTRAGNFEISDTGNIVSSDRKMLIGDDGPIIIQSEYLNDPLITKDIKSQDLKITDRGDIYLNEFLIGNIKLADIPNPDTLQKATSQCFFGNENTIISYVPYDEIKLKQGWLEGSNVDIIKEMVAMIELQRIFEAGTKVIQTNERTLDDSFRIGRYI